MVRKMEDTKSHALQSETLWRRKLLHMSHLPAHPNGPSPTHTQKSNERCTLASQGLGRKLTGQWCRPHSCETWSWREREKGEEREREGEKF